MKRPRNPCAEIELDLIAAATGEADPVAERRVQQHVSGCAPCGGDYHRYRAIEQAVETWRRAPAPAGPPAAARRRLEERLEEIRRRTVAYRIFPSPLGNILIALSERGVSMVEYLGRRRDLAHSRLGRMPSVDPVEDGAELEALHRELLEYLEGKRTRLEWPLDLALARSEFHRSVLRATAGIPHGAVMSYAGVACEVGKPSATRAVAQALRWNPLPIVIPCHRVVGSSGDLTGYAGDKLDLKERLLAVEGVAVAPRARRICRESMYVRYPGDDSYCLPSCPSLTTVDHPHRLVFFGTRQRAEAAGLVPCTTCRPDVHPIAS